MILNKQKHVVFILSILVINLKTCLSDACTQNSDDVSYEQYTKLIRVDGIAPTCNQRPNCKTYKLNSGVISVEWVYN